MTRVLITGGTGSFGNTVARRFLKNNEISEVIVFSRDESKQHTMRQHLPDKKLSFVVGDVRDYDAIRRATKGVDVIFHAAALKHVPTGEFFPMELVKTNILGTENVLRAAEENNVKRCVLLSTDKAAYPVNVMGMSKALAEKLVGCHARETKNTIFCSVRYGNVMASRGSVIPVFVEAIKAGREITVTDPNMTRFLLSLEDAVDLVELAVAKGERGDLFIKKAPAATVADIAQAVKNIFNSNAEIKIIGVRAGEKIHETLATQLELANAQDLGDYYRIRDLALLDYDEFFTEGTIEKVGQDYTSANTERLSLEQVTALIRELPYIQAELKYIV